MLFSIIIYTSSIIYIHIIIYIFVIILYYITDYFHYTGICSEVPQVITGDFRSDIKGIWSTNPDFSLVLNCYTVSLLALQYTTETWSNRFQAIADRLKYLGDISANKDYAWQVWSK